MSFSSSQSTTKQYNFTDFTEEHYRNILCLAQSYYNFEFFETNNNKPHVLWRHDIDFSVHRALKLAQIEAEMGIKSTYFLLLHSEYYNLLEIEVAQRVRSILNLGHQVGLHFYPTFYPDLNSLEKLEEFLLLEKQILETIFNTEIKVFSFHNPDLSGGLSYTKDKIAGMINTYSSSLKQKYQYCSDSNGYWRFNRLWDVIESRENPYIHVLTHPEWWTPETLSPKERIKRCIDGRYNYLTEFYAKSLQEIGRLNIG